MRTFYVKYNKICFFVFVFLFRDVKVLTECCQYLKKYLSLTLMCESFRNQQTFKLNCWTNAVFTHGLTIEGSIFFVYKCTNHGFWFLIYLCLPQNRNPFLISLCCVFLVGSDRLWRRMQCLWSALNGPELIRRVDG